MQCFIQVAKKFKSTYNCFFVELKNYIYTQELLKLIVLKTLNKNIF